MRYVVTGRVQPERAEIYFGRVEMGIGEKGKAIVSCDASQITVVLDLPNIDGWISAMVTAEDVASIVVGSLASPLCSGSSLELIQLTQQPSTPHAFRVRPVYPERDGDTLPFTT